MGNLIRLKQIDKPEFSGYIEQVGDSAYYSITNPSGFISSIDQDTGFLQLQLDVSTLSGDVNSDLATTGSTLASNLNSTGSYLNSKINDLSGYVELSNDDILIVSGNVNTARNVATGYAYTIGTDLSGDVNSLSGYVVAQDTVLNSKITTASGALSSRVSSLEGVFAASGSNFVDVSSNNQVVSGQKTFQSRVDFNLVNITPVSGGFVNPGGMNNYFFTEYTDDIVFLVSGSGLTGYLTGDLFVTKAIYPNDEECVISSNIYTGNY